MNDKPKKSKNKFSNIKALLTENGIILRPEDLKRLREMGMIPSGIVFDSILEAEYYRDVLLPQVTAGKIEVQLQPKFPVQDKFEKFGVAHRAITYIPDFLVTYRDGTLEAIDVKGMQTEVFAIKRKLFDFHYPTILLLVLKRVIKYGGWITVEEYAKLKKTERKQMRSLERGASPARRRKKRAINSY